MSRSLFTLLIGVLLFTTSCFKELAEDLNKIEDLRWNPSIALPLANGSFTIAEFAEDLSGEDFSYYSRNDGLVVFRYAQDEVISEYAEDLIDIEDENYVSSISIPASSTADLPINGSVTTQNLHEFGLNTGFDDKLYSTTLKGGYLQIDLTGNFPTSGELVFTFNGLTNNGNTLETTFEWEYDGSNSQSLQRTIDLNGLDMDLTNNGITYNYFYFTSTLTLYYEGQSITSTQSIDIDLDLYDLEFSQAFATVGRRTIATESNLMTFDFTDELRGGLYYFDEPSLNFTFSNSFGIPVNAEVVEAIANSNTNGSLGLIGEAVTDPFVLNHPSASQIGEVVDTEFSINHLNSNLPVMLAWQPNTIAYTFQGIVNPEENDNIHFVLDTSRISADINMELPMIGRFRNLRFAENYDFDGSDLEEADFALFKLSSSNGFPIDAAMQLYFLDNSSNLIDSLIYEDNKILEAGLTDNTGKVIEATEKEVEVLIPKERLESIAGATRLLLRARLDTPENDIRSVRIHEDDRLQIKLHVQTEFEIVL